MRRWQERAEAGGGASRGMDGVIFEERLPESSLGCAVRQELFSKAVSPSFLSCSFAEGGWELPCPLMQNLTTHRLLTAETSLKMVTHPQLSVAESEIGKTRREEGGRMVERGKEKEPEVGHCAEEKGKKEEKNHCELLRSGWRLALGSLMLFSPKVAWK